MKSKYNYIYISKIYIMSNTISYDKNKLQTFINAYNDMNSSMASYNDKINNFQEAVQLLTDGFSRDANNDMSERYQQYHFFETQSSPTKYYMVTNENVLIQMVQEPDSVGIIRGGNGKRIPKFILDASSQAILDDKTNFANTVVEITGTFDNVAGTNSQYFTANTGILVTDGGGTSTLTIRAVYSADSIDTTDSGDFMHLTNIMRYRNNNMQPDYLGIRSINYPLTRIGNRHGVKQMTGDLVFTHGEGCTNEFYQKCAMEVVDINKNEDTRVYYGLHENDANRCECYDMTKKDVDGMQSIDYYEEEVYESSDTNPMMHYFGLFMDGRVMGLNKENYYENFDDFFTVNTDNLVTDGIPNTNMNSSLSGLNLNPFVGHGMHTFDIENITDRRPPS